MIQGKQYTDDDAENPINRGSVDNPKLTKSPFIVTFQYGASAEGYWVYERMILQLEDCIDWIRVLHPQCDFVFIFYHSCVHDRGQENGLNDKRVNVVFSGKQPKINNTVIKDGAGYLGHFKGSLRKVGFQEMVLQVYEYK